MLKCGIDIELCVLVLQSLQFGDSRRARNGRGVTSVRTWDQISTAIWSFFQSRCNVSVYIRPAKHNDNASTNGREGKLKKLIFIKLQ